MSGAKSRISFRFQLDEVLKLTANWGRDVYLVWYINWPTGRVLHPKLCLAYICSPKGGNQWECKRKRHHLHVITDGWLSCKVTSGGLQESTVLFNEVFCRHFTLLSLRLLLAATIPLTFFVFDRRRMSGRSFVSCHLTSLDGAELLQWEEETIWGFALPTL